VVCSRDLGPVRRGTGANGAGELLSDLGRRRRTRDRRDNVGVIGQRFPAIAALPLVPQLADNVVFGAVFGFVVDR
jgi:hypothetical protein